MMMMDDDASTMEAGKIPEKRKPRFTFGAHNYVLEFIANTNLFMLCCVAACFSLVSCACRVMLGFFLMDFSSVSKCVF